MLSVFFKILLDWNKANMINTLIVPQPLVPIVPIGAPKKRKKPIGKYEIPFDANGNQLLRIPYRYHYGNTQGPNAPTMVPNYEFEDVLTYKSHLSMTYSDKLRFTRSDGTEVIMFMRDAYKIIPKMILGKLPGKFAFVKRGQTFGCAMRED